ncbi:accessory Sec system protein Asp2 [Staphylococcus casei]|uniref:Accessory Sec system protein Asp2 n=1 Tax=Staphylococcus casei TaxID=201828 RepID=A0ABZ2WBB8_9STAP|nr:hypothetical protein BU056_03760 [Staphylococcus succinus]
MVPNKIYQLDENIDFENQKRILIDTGDNENYIQKARTSSVIYEKYLELLKQDYILFFHQKTISKFYKRTHVSDLFERKDLIESEGVFYTIDNPEGRKINQLDTPKLLVLFTCMPNANDYDSALIPKRMFPKFFDGIERHLVKNVYVMRIMDLNASHGSHYINTVNYRFFEANISKAIENVRRELNVESENVVLYGASKGGTGALYYSSKLDYKCLAVDPIISLKEYNLNDAHFLKTLRKEDLSNDINMFLKQGSTRQKYMIASENVPFNFSVASKIVGDKIDLINKQDKHITAHPEVSRNTVPEQHMLLNLLLQGHNML